MWPTTHELPSSAIFEMRKSSHVPILVSREAADFGQRPLQAFEKRHLQIRIVRRMIHALGSTETS